MDNKEILIKPIYKSRKDILNKMPPLKTERDENINELSKIQNNQYIIPKKFKNLGKKNLTYQNFLEYTYNYNNITEHKIKMPDHLKIKQKYELKLDSEYPSVISKKPFKKVTPLLITGINTSNSKKYNIFSTSQKSFENNSELKTKSSSNKYIRSNFLNYNNSNKNDFLFPSSEISNSVIRFHGDVEKFTKNENKDEGLKAFVQKSKIILKGKIIQKDLVDKLTYKNELIKEELNIIKQKEKQLHKNLDLLDKFEKVYINYLKELIEEEAQETRIYYLLSTKKIELENEITNLLKKIEKMKNELTKYDSLKRFFKFSKTSLDSLSEKGTEKKETNKKDKPIKQKEIFAAMNIDDKKQKVPNKKILDFRKNFMLALNKKMLSYRHKLPEKKKESPLKNRISKFNSLKPIEKKIEEKINVEENKNEKIEKIEKTNSKKHKDILNKRKSRRASSMLVHQKQYEHMFTKVEDLIIKDLEINDVKRNQIYEGKKNLEETQIFYKSQNKYVKELIIQKEQILSRLIEDNTNLTNHFKSISKPSYEKGLSEDILEEKMIQMILNIQNEINIQEILKVNNLTSIIKLKSQDFLERFRIVKVIYLIKTIELVISYLISKKNQYLSDPKLKEALKNFLFSLENDKKLRMNKLNKKILKKEMEKKKLKAFDKATKIRFFHYRKFDLSHFKNKRHKSLKEKTSNTTENDNQYEEWFLYD